MRTRDDTVLDPRVEHELAALDAALAGDPVDPELAELEALVHAVAAERPSPREEFARELDARVAAGFPGHGRLPRLGGRIAGALTGRSTSRRMVMPALGVAAAALVGVTVAASLVGSREERDPALRPSIAQTRSLETDAIGGAARELSAPTASPAGPQAARRVERHVSLTLAAPANRIDEVAAGVLQVVDQVNGIVSESAVRSGDRGQAGASFELRVPTAKLGDALSRLSKLAHVRSRTEEAQDVTDTFVSAQERLGETLAERSSLLRQLANADTPTEAESIRTRLRIASNAIAAQRAQLARLRQRTDYSVVDVTVDQTRGESGTGGAWTPKDAWRDAIRVLEVAAGVALVTLSLLVPLGALGLMLWLTTRASRRRRREHALDLA